MGCGQEGWALFLTGILPSFICLLIKIHSFLHSVISIHSFVYSLILLFLHIHEFTYFFIDVHFRIPFHSCNFFLSTYNVPRVVLSVLGQKGPWLRELSLLHKPDPRGSGAACWRLLDAAQKLWEPQDRAHGTLGHASGNQTPWVTDTMLLAPKWIFSRLRWVGKARSPFPVFVGHVCKVVTEAGWT